MLTTQPSLRTRRPSPTAVEFTISNAPAVSLPTTLVLVLTTSLLRIIILCSSILVLLSKFHTPGPDILSTVDAVLAAVHSSPAGHLAARVAAQASRPTVLVVALAATYLSLRRIHTTESLLVLRGLGIQTSSSQGSILASNATRFIPTEKIQDVLVNEAFVGFEVRYVLVIVVAGEEDMVVVFPKLRPRKDVVLAVWRGIRRCLHVAEDGMVVNGKT